MITLQDSLSFCSIMLDMHIMQFLPVYHPSDEEVSNTKLYARNVQILMARYIRAITSQYTAVSCFVTLRQHLPLSLSLSLPPSPSPSFSVPLPLFLISSLITIIFLYSQLLLSSLEPLEYLTQTTP